MKTYMYRASNLKSMIIFWLQFHGGSQFLVTTKTAVSCFFIIIRECGCGGSQFLATTKTVVSL